MIARVVGICMLVAFLVSKTHSFWIHWHLHSLTWHAADMLLQSEVCTKSYLRMKLRQFDNCDAAEATAALGPFYRAIYSVAEEIHICGESRCAILYMDITDRLVYILPLTFVLMIVLMLKFGLDYRYQAAKAQYGQYTLPQQCNKKFM